METTNIFLGTELKLNINVEPIDDITMDDYDFQVEVYCSPKRTVVINKEDCIRIDENNYIILVDSEELGAGDLKLKIIAEIPDDDFNDGFRKEIMAIDTELNIIKAI